MLEAEAHQIMMTRGVAAVGALAEVVLDNVSTPEPVGEHVTFTFGHIADQQASLGPVGGRRFNRRELLVARIHALRDTGTASTIALVQALRDGFEGFASGELWVVNTAPRFAGMNGRFRMEDFEIAFNFHETK